MIKLNTGFNIPKFGFGTWQIPADKATDSVDFAIKTGFRHIDCAALYENEPEVGEGIRRGLAETGLKREEIFITSKVWNTNRGYDKTMRSLEQSLKDLGLEYLDLFLIHWPANPFQFDNWKELNLDTWRALEAGVKNGVIRSIGLSNFMPRHIKPIIDKFEIKPAVNQIEYHPGWNQPECVEYCSENGMAVEAWSPLGQGSALTHPLIIELAEKYGCTASQITLAWVMACGVIPLTRSIKPERIVENYNSLNVKIDKVDQEKISALIPFGGKCRNPDLVAY